jgi:hypothetical protein
MIRALHTTESAFNLKSYAGEALRKQFQANDVS